MENKQTIINGIDVSRCKHYKNRNCIADYCLTDMPFSEAKCELNTNCYYKQLKHKEQECNRYKQTLSEIQQDLEFATYCESQECGCDDANECLECTKKQILQKISEVEDGN